MIIVEIWPTGVGEVSVEAPTRPAEDLDLAIWPVVREALDDLDQRLRARASVVDPVPPVGRTPGGKAA